MAKYGKKAKRTLKQTMHKYKRGKLRSSQGGKVKKYKQAVAIGLSEARRKGAKVSSHSKHRRSTARSRSKTRTRIRKY